ncbi:MAG: tyrosine-type recombinase/integrase [Chitinophagaceae bacterium]|nr:tyrosine-type recombinase/integrase [Chitinophagaceae bacterium]
MHLKEIAKQAKINKSISNKVARHTNAQLWVRYGAEGAIISKMMGHTKQESTKNYYDVKIPEIVEGTKRADFRKLGI